MDIPIPQHFLQSILSFFSGIIKMFVEIQMEKLPLGNHASTRFTVALAKAGILDLILAPVENELVYCSTVFYLTICILKKVEMSC